MLDAAIKLGSIHDFERVQMQDVATEAEVAIATLYRYFPSKPHLFVGVMKAGMSDIDRSRVAAQPGQDPVVVIADMLVEFTAMMMRNRRLSMSMMQSIMLAEALDCPDREDVDRIFLEMLLRIAGWEPGVDEDQSRRCWLVIQCWFGVLISTMAGTRPLATAEVDVRRSCELLLR